MRPGEGMPVQVPGAVYLLPHQQDMFEEIAIAS